MVSKLLDMSIAASWVVLAVLLFRFVFRKSPKWIHCALWGLVAFRLICPVTLESDLSLIPAEKTRTVVEEAMDDYVGSTNIYWDITEEYSVAVEAGREPVYGEEQGSYVVTGKMPNEAPTVLEDVLTPLWLTGMLIMAVYAVYSYLRLRKRVSASIALTENLYLCDYIDTPFILGIIRPKIYLPSAMEPKAASHVLAHERAHIKRRDHWWKPMGFLLLTIHWFNPVMWLAYVLLCRDIELACDEKVIREMGEVDKKAYSEALLACSVPRHMVAACPLAFGEVGVKERVKSVLNYKKPSFWIVMVAVVLCIAVAVCFLTDPKEKPDEIFRYVYETPYEWTRNVKVEDIAFSSVSLHEDDVYSSPIEGSKLEALVMLLNQVKESELAEKVPEGTEDPLWNTKGTHIFLFYNENESILLRYVDDIVILSAETDSNLWDVEGYWTIENEELKQWMQNLSYGGTYMLSEENREEVRQLLKMNFVEFFDPQSYENWIFVGCNYDHGRGLGVACFQANSQGGYDLVQVIRDSDVHACTSGSALYYCDYEDYRIFLVMNQSITAIEWTGDYENKHEIDRHPAVVVQHCDSEWNAKYRFYYSNGSNTTMYMVYEGCHHHD